MTLEILFSMKKVNGEQNRVCTCGDGELLKLEDLEPLLVAQNIQIVNLLDHYPELKQKRNNNSIRAKRNRIE